MEYFDYESVAKQANLSVDHVNAIVQKVLQDYPSDPMLMELHVMRVCRAIRDGVITLEQAISSLSVPAPSPA